MPKVMRLYVGISLILLAIFPVIGHLILGALSFLLKMALVTTVLSFTLFLLKQGIQESIKYIKSRGKKND